MNESTAIPRRRSLFAKWIKYIVDPRRISHKYLLQALLCLFLTGPTLFDNFFNACVTDIIADLGITHEKFSLLVSIPSITGVFCGAIAGVVYAYGSTLVAVTTAILSFFGAVCMCYGISESSYTVIMSGRIVFVMFWNLLGSVQKVIIFRQFSGTALAFIFGMKILAIRLGAVSGLYFAGDIMVQMHGSLSGGFCYALALSALSLICTCAFAYLYRGSSTAREIRPYLIGHRRPRADSSPAVSYSPLSVPRDTWICCLVVFLYYGGIVPFETFGVDYLVTAFQFSKTDAAQAMALLPFFSFFSPLLGPLVVSIHRQLLGLLLSQLLVGVCICAEILQTAYTPYLYLCLMGVGHLFIANAVWLTLAGVSPTEQEKTNAASLSSAIHALSGFTFNWLTGRIRDVFGNYNAALGLLSTLIILGAFVSWYLLSKGDWTHRVVTNIATTINDSTSAESPLETPLVTSVLVDEEYFIRTTPPRHTNYNI